MWQAGTSHSRWVETLLSSIESPPSSSFTLLSGRRLTQLSMVRTTAGMTSRPRATRRLPSTATSAARVPGGGGRSLCRPTASTSRSRGSLRSWRVSSSSSSASAASKPTSARRCWSSPGSTCLPELFRSRIGRHCGKWKGALICITSASTAASLPGPGAGRPPFAPGTAPPAPQRRTNDVRELRERPTASAPGGRGRSQLADRRAREFAVP